MERDLFFFFFLGVRLGQGLNWKLAILVEVGVQDTVLTFEWLWLWEGSLVVLGQVVNGEAVFLLLMICFMVLGWWMVKVSCRALQGFSFAHFIWWSKILFFFFGFSATEKILGCVFFFFFFISKYTLRAHRIEPLPHLPPLTSKDHCHENTSAFMICCSSLRAIWDGW